MTRVMVMKMGRMMGRKMRIVGWLETYKTTKVVREVVLMVGVMKIVEIRMSLVKRRIEKTIWLRWMDVSHVKAIKCHRVVILRK